MSTWPLDNSFAAFRAKLPVCADTVYCEFFNTFRDEIKVKRESAAVKNLQTIFKGIFELAYQRGFDAMSLRDLSTHTGISMGGLYNYISSKDKIAEMAERFLGGRLAEMASALGEHGGSPWQRLETKIRIYVYMSSIFRPWYRFVYMEAKAMAPQQKNQAKQFDIVDTAKFKQLIDDCIASGDHTSLDAQLTANSILAMIQDWYLKAWKYNQQHIKTDQYADYLVATAQKLLAINDHDISETSF